MKRVFLFVWFLVGASFCFAQDVTVPSADSFEQRHSDKSVIFLRDNFTLQVNEDWSYVYRLDKKIKILKDDAKALGEAPISYRKGIDTVKVLRARTLTPDGKIHQAAKTQELNPYSSYPMYSDSMVKTITLREVNVGSVLELETETISKGMPIKNAFWHSFSLDHARPTKESRIKIILPKKLNIAYKAFSLEYLPAITETPQTITYEWNLKDLDPVEPDEDFLPPPTPESFTNAIEFSSIKNWRDVSSWYQALVIKNLKQTKEIIDVARKLCEGKATARDKARAILEYLTKNFRYVSMSFGENSLEPHPTDEVFRNKYGDCKDLSLLCMAMLKAVGVNSSIALFNTEFSLSDPKFDLPLPDLFDHVIVLVEDKERGDFYLDPLLEGYDIEEYPASFQGAYTFVINDSGGMFGRFPIFDEKRAYTIEKEMIDINEDGSATFDVRQSWDLNSSIETRDSFRKMDSKAEKRFYEAMDNYLTLGGEMIERGFEGLDKPYGPVTCHAKYKRKNVFPLDGDMMVIDITGYDRDIDFAQKERKNPIFFPLNSLAEETLIYKIPEGFSIAHLPKNIHLNSGFFELKRDYKAKGREIIITETSRYKRGEFPKGEYAKIKEFYNKLPSRTNQRIILKRMKSWQKVLKGIFTKGE